jgi:predicted PurR-regulated permease PerM
MVTFNKTDYDKTQLNLALEASIHIGLAILPSTACLLILLPFIPLLTWGIVIAVAVYPGFQKLQLALGGRGVLTSVLLTILVLTFLIIPVVLLAETLVQGVQTLTAHFKEGTLIIPPPPAGVETWPVIGAPLNSLWSRASQDLSEAVRSFAPQIKRLFLGCSLFLPASASPCCNSLFPL